MADNAYADWLQRGERTLVIDDAGAAAWGAVARTVDLSSCIDVSADAQAVAAPIATFLASAVVEEEVSFPAILSVNDLAGKVVTVSVPGHAIYSAGKDVLVLGGGVEHAVGVTQLIVLRRL